MIDDVNKFTNRNHSITAVTFFLGSITNFNWHAIMTKNKILLREHIPAIHTRRLLEVGRALPVACNGLCEPINFTMVYSGALHKAKWMINLLYAVNIVLLSGLIQEQRLRAETVAKSKISKSKRFAVFEVAVYALWWFVCPSLPLIL